MLCTQCFRVAVTDFGLAQLDGAGEAHRGLASGAADRPDARSDGSLVGSGARIIVGTPGYMAPEQRRGEPADARSDQYAFCASLHEALYGHVPDAAGEVRRQDRGGPPAFVHDALQRGLAADPAARFPTMTALLEELTRDPRRELRRAAAAGVALAIAAAALAGGWQLGTVRADAAPSFAPASEKLAGVWDDARRAEVERGMLATGKPHAGAAFRTVDRRLGAYVERWAGAYAEAAAAARRRDPLAAARMACLEDARAEVRTVVELLGQRDAALLENAVVIVEELPAPAMCESPAELRWRAPGPTDARARADADALLQDLARASVLRQSTRAKESLEVSERVVDRARAIGDRALLGRALCARGQTLAITGSDVVAAERALREAGTHVDAAGDDRTRVLAMTWLVHVLGYMQGRWGETSILADQARAGIDRLGRPADLEGGQAGKPVPYGRFIDAHPATCWRYYHVTQFAKSLARCPAQPPLRKAPMRGTGAPLPAEAVSASPGKRA